VAPPRVDLDVQSDWVPRSFDGSLGELESMLNTVRGKRNDVLLRLADLGQAWQVINDDQDPLENFDTNTDATISALDAVQSAYLTYQDAWLELTANAASYQNTYRAYFDNLCDGTRYSAVLMGIQALPRDIGGLRPNSEYIEKITRALNEFGDAAGFQSKLGGTVFTVAKTTHSVLEKAEYTLGLFTGGTYTMAALTTRAGLIAVAKTVARNYVVGEVAGQLVTPVMQAGLDLLAQANINVNPTYVRAGMLALQGTGLIKAAKAKLKTSLRRFNWNLSGKCKPSGVNFSRVRWTKVTDQAAEAVWTEFNNTRRAQFLKSLANDPVKVKAMRKMGLTKDDIKDMTNGKVPARYQVHHKKARAFGGGNEDDNLMLMKSENPNLHSQVTTLQGQEAGGMNPGQTRTMEFPMFEGRYFCNERGSV